MSDRLKALFARWGAASAPGGADLAARMVRTQVEARGIRNPRVLEVMSSLDRRLFVPDWERSDAFDDRALPIGRNQTISQPYIVGAMTEALLLEPGHGVLEVGTGTGYQTAVLAALCRRVVSVERIRELAADARARLESLGIDNVDIHVADGMGGWPADAPYERIIVTAAPRRIPAALFDQLAPGGVLVAPEGPAGDEDDFGGYQVLRRWRKTAQGKCDAERLMDVRFVPLIPGVEED